MAQDLSRVDPNRPEDHPVMKRVLEETDLYVEDYRDRERNIFQKIFPDRQQRQIELARHKTVKARYEFLLKALQIDHQAQIQGIQEMYNDFLVKGKAKIRKDRAEYFQQQLELLLNSLTKKSQEFSQEMEAAYQKLESVKVDFLRERQEQLIQTVVAGYYETAEKLIANFRKILDEEIHNAGAYVSASAADD